MKLFEIKKSKKDSVIDFIDNNVRDHHERMQEQYRSWMLNLAWSRGYQNYDYDTNTRRYLNSRSKKDAHRVRLISNMMLPIVRRVVSLYMHTGTVWDVIPATSDEADIQIAEKSTKVLRDSWQRVGMSRKLIRLLHWQSTCSNAFLKVGWDFDEGDEFVVETKDVDEQLIKQYSEFLGLEVPPEATLQLQTGQEFIDIVPPFNITLPENVAVLDESDWIIESTLRSKDWVISKFGSKYESLSETAEHETFMYPFMLNYGQGERQTSKIKKGVLVHELFVRKKKNDKKYKDGLHALVADGQFLITPQKHPYDHGELPYEHFLEIYDPGSLWGTCAVEQARPQQARYNRISSAVVENINLMSNVQWLVPHQSKHTTLTNKPGDNIYYQYPYKPEQSDNKPIPAYVDRMLDRTRLDMQDTTSTHEVSEAKAEPGVRSGRAVLALQESDDRIVSPGLAWFDEGLARVGRLNLQNIIQHTKNQRVITVQGDFNEQEVISFSGEDLVGKSTQNNYWKVRVKTAGRQAMSRAGREALADRLVQLGILHPQIHRDLILHILNAADLISVYDQDSMDRIRQYKEIIAITQAIKEQQPSPVRVYTGQKHTVHIECIQKYMSSRNWDQLEEQVKIAIENHLAEHMKKLVLEQMFPQIVAAELGAGGNNSSTGGNDVRRTSQNRGSSGRTNGRAAQTGSRR